MFPLMKRSSGDLGPGQPLMLTVSCRFLWPAVGPGLAEGPPMMVFLVEFESHVHD